MPDTPSAEFEIDEALVRSLVAGRTSVLPDAATLPLVHVADGWDCSVWKLGDAWAVRLPRRSAAAPLVEHEQRVLDEIAVRLAGSGVGVPAPIVAGAPANGYPWPWSVTPWFDGSPGHRVPRSQRTAWAEPLARALILLHTEAPPDFPRNPVRGVPFVHRAAAISARFASVEGRVPDAALARMRRLWDAALLADPWTEKPVWIHGDLHPGNLIADGPALVAIIDFGDVTAGDPAYDLAIAWLAFDPAGRSRFAAATRGRYDDTTWIRAHGWAAVIALILLDQSDDNPEYAALGAECLHELLR